MPGAMSQNVKWDGVRYAANNAHHRRYDDEFLRTLALRGEERVLDVGCGSGELTARLADMVPDGSVVGLDPSASLLDQARRHAAANQSFRLGPAQRMVELAGPEPFDVVVSRAAFHWVPAADQSGVLGGIARVLRPGGLLRLECGGGDNVAAVVALLDEVSARHAGPRLPWAFPEAGWFLELAERAGFAFDDGWVRLVAQRRAFDRGGLLGWLDSQVLNAYTADMSPATADAFRADVLDRLDELRRADGSHDVTFVRLDVCGRRLPAGPS